MNVYQQAIKLWLDAGLPDDLIKIIGVQRKGTTSLDNRFDDRFLVIIGEAFFNLVGTTDPGKGITLEPLTVDGITGAAHVKPGAHKGIWMRGLHGRGAYRHEALIQIGAPISILRDTDKNGIGDVKIEQNGYFGINFHRAAKLTDDESVNNWSWGCQVVQHAEAHEELMILFDQTVSKGFKFSFYLATEDQLPGAFV
jgi:hypothetical protein